jgi:hypothetical protein
VAGPDVSLPVAGIGAGAAALLLATLAIGRPEGVAAALALLGGAYALILAIDEPPLDARAAVVAGALLATGELAHLSLDARSTVTTEPGVVARRVGSVALFTLLALGLGGILLVLVDLLRTGGLAIEAAGVAAAIAAVGLLVLAARDTGGGEPS